MRVRRLKPNIVVVVLSPQLQALDCRLPQLVQIALRAAGTIVSGFAAFVNLDRARASIAPNDSDPGLKKP
jgi:hypothetical protein